MVTELPPIAPNGSYSQTQVARLLGVSYDTVHRWINMPDGLRAQYSKINGYPRIQGKEIVRFFNARY